ncbi:MAG: trigger factor [Rhodospirillales bacterium]|nr:trigger factor [Rhodospirillales bacterium]
MQVTETKTETLKREFTVAIPADEIEEKINGRLMELAKTINLPGFRPGKAPVSLLRKQYGPSVMGEVLEKTVQESTVKVISDNELKVAMQPQIEITAFEDGSDLEYTMAVELLPEIEDFDFSKVELEQHVIEVPEDAIEKSIEEMAQAHKTWNTTDGKRAAKEGDQVVIDFVGKVGGEEFAGGKADGYPLELGTKTFIPGFEEQLVGVKVGDKLTVKVTFPENYGGEELAGKDAEFDVEVKELRESAAAVIDDELAKKMGLESLEQMQQMVRDDHEREFKSLSRMRLKRALLDDLENRFDFDLPAGMVDRESDAIWHQFEERRKAGEDVVDKDDEGKSDDELKAEYREIAERRVRLGLVLSDISSKNNIQVSQDEINKAITAESRRYSGQEQQVLDYFKSNPEAQQQIYGPLLEDKVVDFIIELAKLTDTKISIEDFFKLPEDPAPKAKAKSKAKPKAKPKAKAAAKDGDTKKAAAKKPAAKKTAKKTAAKDK